MYTRFAAAAALLAAGWIALSATATSATTAALERAAADWDRGDYVSALTTYQELLAGPDAAAAVEPIALQTGELYRTTELTRDGAAPVFAPDSRHFSFETGTGVSAGTASGGGRTTHVRATASPSSDLVNLDGGDATFCPDGRHVVFLRMPPSPALTEAQAAASTAAGAERIAARQSIARLVAAQGQIVIRDLETARDERVDTGGLLKTGITCAADGAVLFAGAAEGDTAATQIYLARPGSAPQPLTQGPGFKVPAEIDAGGHTLLFLEPRGGPFGGGSGGRGSGRGNATSSFGVVTLDGTSATADGVAPSLARNGSAVAWIARTGPPAESGEQRLLYAPATALSSPVELHKGTDRIDAPAVAPDGSRVAFQMMPRDDWELYLVGHDGKDEVRVTREIQHDIVPQFLGAGRLLGLTGEPRHRRSFLYEPADPAHPAAGFTRTRLFHNNTVRTIAPEYVWVPSGDGTKLLIVAERDGDTVSPERGVYLMDLSARVTVDELKARVAANLESERALREAGRRAFAPIAADVAKVASQASVGRVYGYEKALFDFDSKHITQPGNARASAFLFKTYSSFGYAPELQWFSPRNALGGRTANVVSTLKGTVNPELVYVVSSHYDSVAIGPGADDDTSGTAALLETARIMAGHPMPATIVFASFTGEEAGLLGSREFVRQAVESKMKIVGALNNDMIGWANDQRLDNTIRYSNPGIRDIQHAAATQFSNLITYDALYYKGTDAAAYYEAFGDIVGGIGSYPVLGNPHYHQSHDLLEGINHQLVAEVAKTTAATLMLLASSPSRIAGLEATASGTGATVSWTPSPEKGITGYVVSWGPEPAPKTLRVTQAKATLPGVAAGTAIRVKAVNAKGLEGWDWARGIVK